MCICAHSNQRIHLIQTSQSTLIREIIWIYQKLYCTSPHTRFFSITFNILPSNISLCHSFMQELLLCKYLFPLRTFSYPFINPFLVLSVILKIHSRGEERDFPSSIQVFHSPSLFDSFASDLPSLLSFILPVSILALKLHCWMCWTGFATLVFLLLMISLLFIFTHEQIKGGNSRSDFFSKAYAVLWVWISMFAQLDKLWMYVHTHTQIDADDTELFLSYWIISTGRESHRHCDTRGIFYFVTVLTLFPVWSFPLF